MSNDDHPQSLRAFLNQLPPEELLRFSQKREDYLVSALVQELEEAQRFPVVELTDPVTGQRTVANLFAQRGRLRRCIHNITNVEQASRKYPNPVPAPEAPVQEAVLLGDEINVLELPVYRHFKDDAGRYITSGIVIVRDPDNGRVNMSFHRMQLKDRNRIAISLHSRGDIWRYFNRSEARGEDLEIAVVIGCHPAYYITAASKIPPDQDDYSWAAAYMDSPALTVPAKTVNIPVPAYAEYVLEGRIKASLREDEGPFGEFTGYSTSRSTRNVFELSCVTRRHDAIYQDLVPGFAWEHLLLSQFTQEIILLEKLQREIPGVKALSLPKNGCHFHAYLSMAPSARGQARQAMMLLFGLDLYLKLIIVVDEDVDVYREEEVLWACATRMQADRDVFIVPDVICNRLDPSSPDGVSAKMGIDATCPPDFEGKRVTLPPEALEKARRLLSK